ncbi:PDZ domain-containing protein [Streptomyces sp. H10-C2]|uniref:S41 family peptidase n=1 Tax=unclassified Streptomyces TaxID=2593676 RepID=UPI0024BBA0B1|nr:MULTISPECIES: S41 family peptidase [unclassified Streptomyces]MDJ0342388.1 PDZ domain-containing protein [Streptomyces sp. PH10-H1]MDJ0372243.1 PDZ domain-containing protein [Streptomyces sp. H10-C2]
MGEVSDGAYLRFPHIHGELLSFVAEDDVWVAPLGPPGAAPGRAWRVTADRTRVGSPRFSPDGSAIAFTTWRSLDPEIHLAPVDGGPARRLTYWGSFDTRVCSWTPDGQVLAVSSHGQPFSYFSWAHSVPTDGGPGGRLPWGPVSDIAVSDVAGERHTLLLTGTPPHEPHAWKRYRGGATGRLWLHGERLVPDIDGHLNSPMFVGDRIAFLSDHEGVGNLYSCRPDGTDLRRHTDHADFYARSAATDGVRVAYQCAGELWMADDLSPGARPSKLDVRLGGPRAGRRAYQVPAASNLDGLACDRTGRASAVCVRGSLYWLTHRDGPARTIADEPGARVRLPEMLGDTGRIAFITDAEGEDGIELAHLPGRASRPAARAARADLADLADLEPLDDPGGSDILDGLDVPDGPDGTAGNASAARPAGPTGTIGAGTTGTAGATGNTGTVGRTAVTGTGRRLGVGELGRVLELVSSPDGGTLAVAANDGRLLLVSTGVAAADGGYDEDDDARDDDPSRTTTGTDAAGIGTGTVSELIWSTNGPVRDLAFSPDSAWLTWSHPGIGRSLRSVKIAKLADRTIIDVTNGRFEDEQPVFTLDGRYLAFLSWRGFDPVYDVHTGDLSFPLGCRPYLVPLNSATPSPFALPVEGRPIGGGLDPAESGGDGGPVVVETEGLASRVTPFPVPASKYSALEPVHDGLVWLRWPISGALGETFTNPTDPSARPTLEYFNLGKSKRTELVHHMDWYAVSGDGKRLAVFDEGDLAVVPATERGDDDSTVYVDMRRILHEVDPPSEWQQSYAEAGRLIRDYFWAPDMCGIDWPAILDQYRPLVERVATPDEFADLLREVLGELGTSHAYVSPARRNEGPAHYQRPIGLLGANFQHNKDGTWTVVRILPGESSDSKARSPLAGTGIREGAVLTHIDGRPVDPCAGPYPLLAGAGGTTVELTFTPPGEGHPRRVAVVPLIDERPLRYQDWVAKRRSVVRHLSGGRCGYLHIPDMGGSGWAQFNRDLRMEVAYEALIVDVRGNAGGHISELVVEKLTRTILGWDLTRNAQPVSYAGNAPRGPVVALADEATSSDGDMITAVFKLLGLGPVVGLRTWGGVVGMTGRHKLGDGTVITVPMNAGWFNAYGWGVENYGVDPDIESLRTPLDWAEGRHGQLDVAVRTALGLLAEHPAATPPDLSQRPDRRRPPLPQR